MSYAILIKLWGPKREEEVIREVVFVGESLHDLSMLGAAKGWLEGLYKEAEPRVMAEGIMGPMKELYAEINKTPPYPPMFSVHAEALGKPPDAPGKEAP